LYHWALLVSGCGERRQNAAYPLEPVCDAIASWYERGNRQEPSLRHPECASDKVLCSLPLTLEGNVTLRALRYETVNGHTYKGVHPFKTPLLLHGAARPRDAMFVLNMAHHDIHFWNNRSGYLRDLRAFISRLTSAPMWRSRAARATGFFAWRSLLPTEHPAAHNIQGLENPVDFYRELDEEASALWRGAGFPVLDVSALAFDVRGNRRRTLTSDSVHLSYAANAHVQASMFAQLCDQRRRLLAAIV
jgi:hypothetical protein